MIRTGVIAKTIGFHRNSCAAGWVVTTGLALVGLVACSHGGISPSKPSGISTTVNEVYSPAASSPAEQARAQALAGYRAMWGDMAAVSATGHYQDPRLALHASGQALSLLYRGVYTNQREGIVSRGAPILHPSIVSSTPAARPIEATISDCSDGTHWLNYKLNGELQNNIPGGRHKVEAIVRLDTNVWKVSQLVVQGTGSC